jgi:hypothetical protein
VPVSDWSDEETRDPLYVDERNFFKSEIWTRDGMAVDCLLYAGNSLAKAEDIFARAIKHRPRIRLTANSLAIILISRSESDLRRREALVSSAAILLHCLGVVLRKTASVVQAAEPILRGGIALVGGEAEPLGCFRKALRYALAMGVHHAEIFLRGGIAFVG